MIPLVELVVKVTCTQPYGYDPAFYILAGFAGAGLFSVFVLKTKYNWKSEALL
jgi:hypothetical protein